MDDAHLLSVSGPDAAPRSSDAALQPRDFSLRGLCSSPKIGRIGITQEACREVPRIFVRHFSPAGSDGFGINSWLDRQAMQMGYRSPLVFAIMPGDIAPPTALGW